MGENFKYVYTRFINRSFIQQKNEQLRTRTKGDLKYSVLQVELERTNRPYKCPKCGLLTEHVKSKNEQIIIHSLPVHGHLLELIFPRIRVNCHDCRYPYEPLPDSIFPNRRVTKKYAQWIYEKCKVMTYFDLEKETGLSDTTLRNIEKEILIKEVSNRKIGNFETLGIDEIQFGHGHQYAHIVSDLDNEEVLFVGDGRKAQDLAPFLLRSGFPNIGNSPAKIKSL